MDINAVLRVGYEQYTNGAINADCLQSYFCGAMNAFLTIGADKSELIAALKQYDNVASVASLIKPTQTGNHYASEIEISDDPFHLDLIDEPHPTMSRHKRKKVKDWEQLILNSLDMSPQEMAWAVSDLEREGHESFETVFPEIGDVFTQSEIDAIRGFVEINPKPRDPDKAFKEALECFLFRSRDKEKAKAFAWKVWKKHKDCLNTEM